MKNNDKIIEKIKINIALSNLETEINANKSKNEYTLKNQKIWRLYEMKKRIAIILVSIILISGTVFAYTNKLFSGIEDDLSISAIYEGNGIVSIYIENKSEKTIKFQDNIKLMRWSDNKEIKPISNKIKIENTTFNSKSIGIMKLDISETYNIDELEKPLDDDHYFFILTNNNFIFGYDWHCTIDFTNDIIENGTNAEINYVDEIKLDNSVEQNSINNELALFYNNYVIEPENRNQKIENYYQKVNELLSSEKSNGKNIISSVDPHLFVGKPDNDMIFDNRVSKELQYQLVSENHSPIDAFNIPVGSSEFDTCMILSAIVPQKERNINTTEGTRIPLIYIFQYDINEFQKPNTYVLIRGNLYTYTELEKYKVYQDDSYVSYNVTELFYSDLDTYINTYTKDRTDIYIDEGVYTRIRNIYNYYKNKENLSKDFYYHK